MKLSSGGWKVLLFSIVFVAGVLIVWQMLRPVPKLPVYNPADLNPKLVDSSLTSATANHRVADFTLQNQHGQTVSQANLEGKIYVTDFFFTTCQSICPKMTTQLLRVAETFKGNDKVMIVSHTVDPETDSVPVLRSYAEANGIDPKQWLMLTGDKKQIYDLARKSYFAVVDEPSPEGPDFVHTENFVLVDTQKRLRGFYDGTNPEEVDKLINDIRTLLEEKE